MTELGAKAARLKWGEGLTWPQVAEACGTSYDQSRSAARRWCDEHPEECEKLDERPEKPAEVEPGITYKSTGENTAEVTGVFTDVRTKEQLLELAQIDTDVWMIQDPLEITAWGGFAKNIEKNLTYDDGKATGYVKQGGIQKTTLWRIHAKLIRRKPVAVMPAVRPIVSQVQYRASAPPQGAGLFRSLTFADTHFGFSKAIHNALLTPFHDRRALDLMVQLAASVKPDRIDILGDILDLPDWSSKYRTAPEFYWTTQPAIYEAFWWLSQLRQAAPRAVISVFEGNHGKRMPNAIMDHLPAAYGLKPGHVSTDWPVMSVPYLLGLESLGIRWIEGYPDAEDWLNDGVALGHGSVARGGAGDTAKKTVQDSDVDRVIGHIHRREAASRTRWLRDDESEAITAWCPGCVCHIDGRVPGKTAKQQWQQGALLIDYSGHGRMRSMHIAPIEEGELILDARRFTARERVQELAQAFPAFNWGV